MAAYKETPDISRKTVSVYYYYVQTYLFKYYTKPTFSYRYQLHNEIVSVTHSAVAVICRSKFLRSVDIFASQKQNIITGWGWGLWSDRCTARLGFGSLTEFV